jgi:hypothetical protein
MKREHELTSLRKHTYLLHGTFLVERRLHQQACGAILEDLPHVDERAQLYYLALVDVIGSPRLIDRLQRGADQSS